MGSDVVDGARRFSRSESPLRWRAEPEIDLRFDPPRVGFGGAAPRELTEEEAEAVLEGELHDPVLSVALDLLRRSGSTRIPDP